MHESSRLTFFYKYVFPVFVIATVVPVVPVLMRFTEAPQAFVWSLLLFLCWLSFWNLFLAFRLRRVVANTKQLCIKTMSGEKIINYGDINYVSETVIVSPKLIFLKYRDTSAGESKLILVVPDTMFFSFFSEYPMTTFLRAQVMRANPNYRRDAEPSRWRLFLLIAAVPFLLLMLMFLSAALN